MSHAVLYMYCTASPLHIDMLNHHTPTSQMVTTHVTLTPSMVLIPVKGMVEDPLYMILCISITPPGTISRDFGVDFTVSVLEDVDVSILWSLFDQVSLVE